jgi:hypothetical protein
MQSTSDNDHREDRPQCDGKRAHAHCHDCDAGGKACRADCVDQRPAGHLTGQRHQATCGQDQADVDLRPGMRRQVDRDERTKAGLNVGKKEAEPVESARARA